MSEDNPTLKHYTIHLQDEEMDLERLDRVTRQLRGELLDLDVEAVDFVQEEKLPEGTKAADAVTLGALAVTVLPNFLPRLVEFLQAWTLRGEGRKVKVKSQVGDRSIELEYTPEALSQGELKTLLETLTSALAEGQAEK
jgi:hypothetical protein